MSTALLMSCALFAGIDTFERAAPADGGVVDGSPPSADGGGDLPTCHAPCDPSACPNGVCFAQIATDLPSPSSLAVVGDSLVWANDGVGDAGGTLMIAPREGGRIIALATSLSAPRVRAAAGATGTTVAYERFADPARLALSAVSADGGLEAIDDGDDIASAAASSTWFAFADDAGALRARERSGGPAYDTDNTRAVLGLAGDVLVTVGASDTLTLLRLSVKDDGAGESVAIATTLAEHPLPPIVDAVLDDERAYVATTSSYIEGALLDGGALRRVGSVTGKIFAMAVDDVDLYVAASEGIFKIEKRSYQMVRRYAIVASAIAIDERFVYFAAGGTVTRAPK